MPLWNAGHVPIYRVQCSTMWLAFGLVVTIALVIDFLAMNRQGAHKVSIKEAAIWSSIWVAVSFAFVGWLWWYLGGLGPDAAARELAHVKSFEFITGYLIEKALAVDNVFVFLLIFTYFRVPLEYQKRLLMIGILIALAFRAVMILLGSWLISEFHWVLYVFGAFLIYTAIKMWRSIGKEPDLESNTALKFLRRHLRVTPHLDGERLLTVHEGAKAATPLLVVICMIGIVDVIFAVDSIPAIFSITTDFFIVLSSNVFAILGLRAMYFLLASVHEKFHLLSYGLAIILAVIGTKMLLIDVVHLHVAWSLLITVVILVVSIVLSVLMPTLGSRVTAFPFSPKEEPSQGTKGA